MSRLCVVLLGSLACCSIGGLGSALAEEPAPLVLFYAAAPDSAPAKTALGALEEVARRRGTVVIDLSPPGEAPALAGTHLRRGIEAYRHFKYDEALGHLEKGVAEASASGARGLSTAELSDLLIYRALALGQIGDAARAWDDFVRAAAVDPTRKLDPVRFSPRVVETFDRAVQAVAGRASVAVRISVADGCEVRVDGRAVAAAASLSLAEGEHYVRVTCTGLVPYGARVLARGERYELRPVLQELRAPTSSRVAAEAAKRGAVQHLWCVLGGSQRGGATLSLRRVLTGNGKSLAGVVLRLGGAPGDRAAVVGAASRLIEPAAKPPPPILPAKATPWYRRPWFWAAAGVVVTSAVLLPFTFDSSPPTGFDVRLDYPR